MFRSVFANNSVFNLHFKKVSMENDNNFGYEKITIVVDNIPLSGKTVLFRGKKLKKPSRTLEEVSQAKKQYEQKRSNENKILLFVVKISSV